MKMTFQELNTLQKYCDNKITYDFFLEGISNIDDYYGKEQWIKFNKNPINFLTTSGRTEFFDKIKKQIIKTEYTG